MRQVRFDLPTPSSSGAADPNLFFHYKEGLLRQNQGKKGHYFNWKFTPAGADYPAAKTLSNV